eukprot:SAG31_NODE_41062_length_278_cov_0.564246_1_plen_34_part_01
MDPWVRPYTVHVQSDTTAVPYMYYSRNTVIPVIP